MRSLTALIIVFATIFSAHAQDFTIKGKVTDSQGNALAGVLVSIEHSDVGTITSLEGTYSISTSDGYQTLIFTLEGYQTQKVFIGGQSSIDISLQKGGSSDESKLSVGFGSQSKKEITGSVAQIGGADISSSPLINLEQANQGKASGMFIQNSSGKLGGESTVRVRGGSTLSNSNQPLYVVDGVPLVSSNQSNINPSNIASIEILKDASAAAIYGSRAANGVIIITTKSGKSDGIKYNADYQFGVSQTPKYLDLMSPNDFNRMVIENTLQPFRFDYTEQDLIDWQNSGVTSVTQGGFTANFPAFYSDLTHNTDWQKEVFQTGLSHRANVGVQGGNDKFNMFASAGFNTQEGILIGNRFDRFNASLSLNSQISSKLSANANVNYIYTKDWKLLEDQDLGSPLQAIVLPPSDTYDASNNYQLQSFSGLYNPLTEINFSDNFGYNNSMIASLGLSYDIMPGLTFDINGGIDFSDLRDELRQGPQTMDGGTTGRSQLVESDLRNYSVNGWLTYSPNMGSDHDLSVVVGASYQESTFESTFRRANLNSISQLEGMASTDTALTEVDIPAGVNVFISSFARVNYSFKSKYIFQFSGRLDGSSKFGTDNRYGIFPAASAGWVISEEGFLQNNGVLSFLKFKASYGIIGNVPIDDFLYRSNYFRAQYADGEAIRLANLANPQLKWESTEQLGVGVEFGIGEKISGSVDYYSKKTSDLLFPVPVSQTSGFNSILKNIGSMENSGIEINLSASPIQQNDFGWTADFNISFNDNKITDLAGSNAIVGSSAFLEDQPAGTFYLREYAGVDPDFGSPLWFLNREPTSDELSDGYVFLLEDVFGERYVTEEWESAERIVAGNPNPAYYGGLTNSFRVKNMELSFMFQFVGDVDLYYETGEIIANSGFALLNQLEGQNDRWFSDEDSDAANPAYNFAEENTNPSTRWIQDGSYIRLKNINFTYHMPSSIVENWGLDFMDIYIGGSNLFTITDYIGYDPDVNYVDPLDGVIGQNISRGIDNFTAPQPRMFITGVKIGF